MNGFKKIEFKEIIQSLLLFETKVVQNTTASVKAFKNSFKPAIVILPLYYAMIKMPSDFLPLSPGAEVLKFILLLAGYISLWLIWPVFIMGVFKVKGNTLAYLSLHNWVQVISLGLQFVLLQIARITQNPNLLILALIFYAVYEGYLLKVVLKRNIIEIIVLFLTGIFIQTAVIFITADALEPLYVASKDMLIEIKM